MSEILKRFLEGLVRFYEANKKLFDWLWEAAAVVVRFFGGAMQFLVYILLGGVVFVMAFVASGIEERILRALWRIKYVGWLLAIFEAVAYYLTVIAVETAVLLVPLPSAHIWVAIGTVVIINIVTIAWHAGHQEFWPKWVRNLFNRPKAVKPNARVNASAAGISSINAPKWQQGVSVLVRQLNPGERIHVYEEKDDYYRIGDGEWIHKQFVDLD